MAHTHHHHHHDGKHKKTRVITPRLYTGAKHEVARPQRHVSVPKLEHEPILPKKYGPIASRANFYKGTPKNIEFVHLKTNSGAKFKVNAEVAGNYMGFLADLEATGYKIFPKQSAGHNHRKIDGTSQWSQHAFGNAIDVNWTFNPLQGGSNLPEDVGRIAHKWGLTWGGNWNPRNRDPMHFEYHQAHQVPPMRIDDMRIANLLSKGTMNPDATLVAAPYAPPTGPAVRERQARVQAPYDDNPCLPEERPRLDPCRVNKQDLV